MHYIKQLTFLRFLAAMLVVIFHFGKETWPFDLKVLSSLFQEGSIAVSFFFFLSGVVMALNYFEKVQFNSKEFFLKRFSRLYPAYLLAFLASLILGIFFYGSFPKGSSIFLQLISLHAWFPGIALEINFPAWSIAVEIFFYLLFPFILIWAKRIGPKKLTIAIVLIWVVSSLQHVLFKEFLDEPSRSAMGQFILYFPLWHLNTFLMGIICANYIRSVQKVNDKNFLRSRILLFFGLITFFLVLGTENTIKSYTHNGLMAPVFFLIIAGLSTDKSFLTRFLSSQAFLLLGNASYSIYLFQWPLFILFTQLIDNENLDGIYFYWYVLTLIIFSVLIYIGFEKKMKNLILGKLMNKQDR